jgi:hypothetical protein
LEESGEFVVIEEKSQKSLLLFKGVQGSENRCLTTKRGRLGKIYLERRKN